MGVYLKSHVTLTLATGLHSPVPLLAHLWWLLPILPCLSSPPLSTFPHFPTFPDCLMSVSQWSVLGPLLYIQSLPVFFFKKYHLYANYFPIYNLPQTPVLTPTAYSVLSLVV